MARLRIKEVATEKGILQSRLQIMAEITPASLNRYWNNKTTSIDLDLIQKIANALEVEPGELIESGSREPEEKSSRGRPSKKDREAA